MKKGEGETKHCRRITMSVTAAISPNESSWGGSGGCLGFLVYLFSAFNQLRTWNGSCDIMQ
jgi:hypothetical protein